EEVNTASVSTASTNVSPASAKIGAASISQDTACTYIASQFSGSQIKFEEINQIDEDDIEEMDIKWNMSLLSMRADRFWKKTGKKISIQGTDMAGFDKSKVECFNCHKMGYFTRECRVPRSQDRGKRDNYRQGSKVEEHNPKALMAIDGVGWDWSFMANEQEDHALVADEEAPIEFALMAKTSVECEVFDNSLCSKKYKKNTKSLNKFRNQKIKFCEKIRGLEIQLEFKINKIESLTNDLELLKKEKGELDTKLIGFQTASKDLDSLLESQRLDKNKEGLGYSAVPPPAQVYSPPKKDLSWTGIPEFADDTVIDYSRPSPVIESTLDDVQNRNSFETEASSSTISSKHFIKKFPTGNTKFSTADLGNEGTAATYPTFLIMSHLMDDMFPLVKEDARLLAKEQSKPDETSGILRKFITEIENLKDLKVKIISNARTPQQNGVAERRNKTLIEAARTITPAIGCFKPFGCHVMILNTLDNLGKFKAKRDEGYFIGYSMSRKAFRVFNKRTKRVEENLHVDFLENKAIEKGTKDAASQEVKKDVSSLRYIALPNWVHDALLESTSSNAQDTRKADAPESSGNPNPTASTTNPQADPMETLAVETPIPIVSSPVPTAYDLNGVEADVSNMETTITASPTPTLRIHKDHPKSQIIGLVDTPIQTRHKSKKVGEQSFIATIHQKTDLTLLQFCLFSCFLSQVEPKKISDALQDPSWEEGIEYDKVFAPVARIEAIRLFLAYALFMGFTVYQMDVKSAFLDGDILKKYGYSDVRSSNTPMAKENPWGKDGTGKDVDLYLYRSMIGSLMYFTASRPDIMFAVYACARHQVTPKECHLHAVKSIFRYLKGHPKLGLWYPKESPFELVAYSYSDYGSATQDRKLTTGGCQFFGRRLILWQCRKQTIVATSTTKAEYVAAASCCGQVLWIQNQLLDYGYNFMNTKIYIDNNSAICIVKNLVYRSKTKHIEIRHHFIRDCFEKKLISVDHIHTDENAADLLTKPFVAGRFQYLVVEHAMRGFIKGNLIIYTTFVSRIVFGWVIGTSKYWGIHRILMIGFRLIPLFWSTARIETTEEGTKILATVDGKLRTVSESSIRRNLNLNDEAGISSFSNTKLFENLQLMGYNILPNQKFTFKKGQFSHQWKYLIHTIMQCLSPKSTGFNEFSSNIATALVCLATNRVYNLSKMIFDGTPTESHYTPTSEASQSSQHQLPSPSLPPVSTASLPTVKPPENPPLRQYTKRTRIAQSSILPLVADEPVSPLRDDSQGEACLTDSGFEADQDRANIAKTSTLPSDSTPRVTSLTTDEGKINRLKARIKLLEDKDRRVAEQSRDDAPIKRRRLDEGEEAVERVSNNTEEMATVLTSMDAASILTSGGVQVVPTAVEVSTATVREEKMVKSKTPKKKKVQEQIDVQLARELEEEMARDTQRMNEQIARDAEIARIHEYHQFATELPIGRRIELISDLVKYQDNYAKVLKYQTQQRKPIKRKQQKEFYTLVLRNQARWKAKHFKGMTLEEIREKFDSVWKQIQDFVPIGSKEEVERFKWKGLRLEQESVKKLKTSEEVKITKKVPKEKLKEMMQLVPVKEMYVEALQVKHPIMDWKVHTEGHRSYWKIIRLEGSSASYQFFVDILKHIDREDLNQLWELVKETLSIRQATSDKEMEIWVELKRLYEPDVKNQLWTHTQNLMHAPVEWKLYDTCGVHYVTSKDKEIYMLVEKDYPL
nr:putative ribonuclease H-like domain-containing protein [Tanacetum cinerariifolium]